MNLIRSILHLAGVHFWTEYELDFFNLYRVQEMCTLCGKRRERAYRKPKPSRFNW